MKSMKEFVAQLSFQEMDEILSDYELFEQKGFIGECALRSRAREYAGAVGDGPNPHITLWMDRLASECALAQRNAYREAYGPLVGSQ